jgi:hypothetical protein
MTTEALPKKNWNLSPQATFLFDRVGFEPTGEEQAKILRSRKQKKLVVGGDQSGKSLEASKDFLIHWLEDALRHNSFDEDSPDGDTLLYWLVAMDYERTRAEFSYIVEDLMKLGLPVESSKRVDPGYIEVKYKDEPKPRLRIETKSGKDPRTLAMFAPHGIVVCEASQVDLETFWKCLSRIAPRDGWLHLSGTFEGSLGWYPGLAAAWAHGSATEQSFRLPSPTNWHLYPGGEADPKILELQRQTSDDFYLERIMGIASPPKGRVFTEFRADVHIREVEYDPDLPLYIWEDPGYGHAHAIHAAQIAQGGQIRVFWELYERGMITEDMIDICMTQPWWKNSNKVLVIDPNYATQHHGTHSIAEIWQRKAGLTTRGVKVKIAEGTERMKSFLKVNPLTGGPGIVWSPSCRGVLSEFGAYPDPFDGQTRVYSWKQDKDGNVVGDEPDDRWNDGLKADIYGIVERFGLVTSAGNEFIPMRRYGTETRRRPSHLKKRERVYAR